MIIMPKNLLKYIVEKISEYSSTYYFITLILLIIFQFDIFKENVPKEIIIDGLIVFTTITLSATSANKLAKKRNGPIRPYIQCSLCSDGKMQQHGKYTCNKCESELTEPPKKK